MAVRMRKVLQTAGLVFGCVTCFFRVYLFVCFPVGIHPCNMPLNIDFFV